MSKFSQKELNSMNKTSLVELATNQQDQIESMQTGPLTAAQLEKDMLIISRNATKLQENIEKNKLEFQEKMKQMDNDFQLAKQKLELEYSSTEGIEATSANDALNQLLENVEKAKEDLTFGLRKAEVDHKEKIDQLIEEYTSKETELKTKLETLQESYDKLEQSYKEKKEALQQSHERENEDLEYKHTIAIRDKNLDMAEKVAKTYKKVVVDESEFKAASEFKRASTEEFNTAVDEAVKNSSAKIYAETGAKFSSEKASLNNEINILKERNKFYEERMAEYKTQIETMSEQIKNIPAQIANAVEASKSTTVVNNESAKK